MRWHVILMAIEIGPKDYWEYWNDTIVQGGDKSAIVCNALISIIKKEILRHQMIVHV